MRTATVCAALLFLAAGVLATPACTTVPGSEILSDRAVLAAPHPWPTAEVLPTTSLPRIIAAHLNKTSIADGDDWNGRIVTSTNVASLEVRTESFSFLARHAGPGEFTFDQHVLDMIPQYRRGYLLEFVARNSTGAAAERFVPIRFL